MKYQPWAKFCSVSNDQHQKAFGSLNNKLHLSDFVGQSQSNQEEKLKFKWPTINKTNQYRMKQ